LPTTQENEVQSNVLTQESALSTSQPVQEKQTMTDLLTQMMFNQMMILNNQMNNDTNNRTSSRRSRPTNRYCWTHGACGHNGHECKHHANGHKSDATFQNRMDGS